jgi:hypothetical protein
MPVDKQVCVIVIQANPSPDLSTDILLAPDWVVDLIIMASIPLDWRQICLNTTNVSE